MIYCKHLDSDFQANLKVSDFTPVKNRGALKAFCAIQIGNLIINDCRIIQENGKRAWLSMPCISYKTQYGTVQYRTLVQIMDEKLKNEISQTALAEWENFKGGTNGKTKK